MEVVVLKYLKNTPFEDILAPIEPHEGFYYMKNLKKRGKYEDLEEKLYEISQNNSLKFKDLSYYFLSDANAGNIREMDGKTVLIDYDDAWGWVFKNKDAIKALKNTEKRAT